MESLQIEETEFTPAVEFNENSMSIKGKSLPENAKSFYEPLISWVTDFQKEQPSRIDVEVALTYFNSSTSKQLLKFFYALEDAQENGCEVNVNWKVDNRDEMIVEKGEEFKDLLDLNFHIS